MYKLLSIDGEEYKLEFSIEASLYNDCIDRVVSLMYSVDEGQTDIRKLFNGVSDLPNTAISCFYAGLLEHHGKEVGDGRVPNISAAKKLATVLLKTEDSGISNWYDLLTICLNQMGEDGFFELIGLTSFLTTEEPGRARKTPQDHKRKTTRVTGV